MTREGCGGARRFGRRRWLRELMVMVDGFGDVPLRRRGRVDGTVSEGIASELLELLRSRWRVEGRRLVVVLLLMLIVSVPCSFRSSFLPLMMSSIRPVLVRTCARVMALTVDGRLIVHSTYNLAVEIIELGRRSGKKKRCEEERGREGTRVRTPSSTTNE